MIDREEVERVAKRLDDIGMPASAALMRSLLSDLAEAIKHCEAMESWTTYEEWGRAADAFRKWMEGRK